MQDLWIHTVLPELVAEIHARPKTEEVLLAALNSRFDSSLQGPAETIDVEEWKATAYNGRQQLVVARDTSSRWLDRTWSELRNIPRR